MSGPDGGLPDGGVDGPMDRRFDAERLLQAHGNRDLTAAEAAHLQMLAGEDPLLAAELDRVEKVHRLFRLEQELEAEMSAPVEPFEEFDETWVRLAAVAAHTGEKVRAHLQHGHHAVLAAPGVRRRFPLRLVAAALAAAAALLLWWAWPQSAAAPTLMPQVPGHETLHGVAPIVLEPVLRADAPTLSWHPVVAAVGYDVVVVDGAGNLLLSRPPAEARSHRWDLTAGQFAQITAGSVELRLRIVARDGAGLPVGTSGDLRLQIR